MVDKEDSSDESEEDRIVDSFDIDGYNNRKLV